MHGRGPLKVRRRSKEERLAEVEAIERKWLSARNQKLIAKSKNLKKRPRLDAAFLRVRLHTSYLAAEPARDNDAVLHWQIQRTCKAELNARSK